MRQVFDWETASADELEAQLSPSRAALRPIADHLAEYARSSAAAGAPAALRLPGRPLLVYVHGGYWQELRAVDSLFNAADAQAEAVSLVAVEYTLAPLATIDTMVAECRTGIREAIETLSPASVVLAGSSAGAHLVACCLGMPGIPSLIDGAALLSGIYDLRPLTRTTINAPLGLTMAAAERLSPMFETFGDLPPVLVATGEHETAEFKRQSGTFAGNLRRGGTSVAELEVAGRDHFDLPYDLLRRGTTLGDWVLFRLGLATAGRP